MKSWLRVPLSILALLAMLATLLPGTVWSCPMTGRVDSAARVCVLRVSDTAASSAEMPCAHMGGKCCKPISAPTPQNDDSRHAPVFAPANPVSPIVAPAVPVFDIAPFVLSHFEAFPDPAVRFYLARFTNSPPLFWTQHRPISLAGRAPPVL